MFHRNGDLSSKNQYFDDEWAGGQSLQDYQVLWLLEENISWAFHQCTPLTFMIVVSYPQSCCGQFSMITVMDNPPQFMMQTVFLPFWCWCFPCIMWWNVIHDDEHRLFSTVLDWPTSEKTLLKGSCRPVNTVCFSPSALLVRESLLHVDFPLIILLRMWYWK